MKLKQPVDNRLVAGRVREGELDFLRSIAIVLAIGWHFNRVNSDYFLVEALLYPGAKIGWAGVDLFFVLSGFLVGRIVLSEIAMVGAFNIRLFYIRRIFKLWPCLYLFIIAMIVGSGRPVADFAPQIGLHVQNYFPPSIATHLWSLAVEEHFYLVFSALVFLGVNTRAPAWTIAACALFAIVAAPILRVTAMRFGTDAMTLQWQTQFRMDALACGVLIAWSAVYAPSVFERLVRAKSLTGATVATGVTFLLAVPKGSVTGSTMGYSVAYITSAALLLFVYQHRWLDWNGKWMRPFSFLAGISYALYIWHVPAAELVDRVAFYVGVDNEVPLMICRYILAIAVASIITAVIERPFLQLRDRIFPKRVGDQI